MRQVARDFGVTLYTVQRWVRRAQGKRLDRVDWEDRSSVPIQIPHRTSTTIERRILSIRKQLRERSSLGEYGAVAIHRELQGQGVQHCPAIRTIGRILERRGVLDGRRRKRRPPPPPGWYLPQVAAGKAELDSFDTIEGLAIRNGPHLTILTGVSLIGGLITVWPERNIIAKTVVEKLIEHWRFLGVPRYAQFDNDNRFQGPKQHRDVVGRVSRLCLNLGVTPVFAPPNETGFQAAIESLNGRWQAKVWSRFEHKSLRGLKTRSARFLAADRERRAARIEAAPPRQPFPKRWRLDLQKPPRGTIVYIRRTDSKGRVKLLGHHFKVDTHWLHRLIRVEVQLNAQRIRFFALRRRAATSQPMLAETPYELPDRPFNE